MTPPILAELLSFRQLVSHMHPGHVRDRLAHSQPVSAASQPQRLLVELLKCFRIVFESCRYSQLASDPRLQQSLLVAGIPSDI